MFGLERLFGSRKPRARSVADRLGGVPEAPVEVRPWTPSERPQRLPWEVEQADPPVQPAGDLSHRNALDPADQESEQAPVEHPQTSSENMLSSDEFLDRRFA